MGEAKVRQKKEGPAFKIIDQIVKQQETGATDALMLLETVAAGVLAICTIPGRDDEVHRVFTNNVKGKLASVRLYLEAAKDTA